LTADELVARLHPPRRFAAARFSTYEPNPAHPSQRAALDAMADFADEVAAGPVAPKRRRWGRRAATDGAGGPGGRYLDGGYGVGKTHLLAALWHSVDGDAAYLSFSELTATIGFLGMEEAVRAFSRFRLLALDEFELDDVANTLMAVTFLRRVMADGVAVAATSNSLPDRLGEGRFNADDFTREIAAIAAHFTTLRIDGPDYRGRGGVLGRTLDDGELTALAGRLPGTVALDDFDALLGHLRRVHPVQFTAMLDGLDAVLLRGLHPLANQGDALLFVHLVDELYDAQVAVAASGCGIDELFPESYRHGGYRKKYGRCESRLSSMLAEQAAATPA
jgi:cell division protein ZapE